MYKSLKVKIDTWKKLKQLALDKDTTIAGLIEEFVSEKM